jgi:tetratricopeptide (TPR) repeat protein
MHALVTALRDAMRLRVGRWAVAAALGVTAASVSITAAFAESPTPVVADAPVVASPTPAPMPEVSADIELGIDRRNGGDLEGSVAVLQPIVDGRVAASELLRIRARQELARTLAAMGFATRAQEHWNGAHEAAIALNADLLAAGIAIDIAHHDGAHKDTVERARTWLRTAEAELRRIEIDPAEHADIVFVTALLAASEGRYREAADGFAAAAKLPAGEETTRVRIHIEWAGALGRLGEHELGLAKIAEGHTMCEANGLGRSLERVELRRTAATLLQNLDRFEGAVQEMDLALELAADIRGVSRGHLSSLHGDLGIFHLQLNHSEESGLHLKKALELAPDSYAAHANLSIHYGKLACHADVPTFGCDEDAADLGYAHKLRALELARETFGEDHPTFATMRANAARDLLNRGEIERAREDFELSCTQLALHFGDEAHQLMNPLYGLVESNVRSGRREDAAAAAERLYEVAHGPAFASRKEAIAVLDYVVGRTLAWNDAPEGRAATLMASGRGFFGDTPPDDFLLIDAWFR